MAIQSFQAPVTTPVKGTSLAEMMGMAQNAQALQQAKQLNPLQIQQAQGVLELQRLQTQKAQQTLEPEVELAKTNAAKAKTELNDAQLLNLQKQQANSSRNLIKMLDSPEPVTPARIKDHVVATMANAGASDAAIIQAVQGLPTIGSDKELRAYLAKHTLNSLTAEAELEKRFPAATMVSEGGQITPRQMGAEAFTGVKPGTVVGQSVGITPSPMQPGVTTVNGVIGQYDANGKFVPFNIQPSQQPSVTPNLGEPNKPAPEQSKMPSIVKIDNFSAPGQQNKQEVDRYALGQSDFNASNERATLAQDSNLTVQNIKKNLSAAAGSTPGRVLRSIGQTVIGDPQLDILVKSLADQQLRQSQLMGLKNQAAEADQKVAGGSSEITAEALAHIVERADATNLAAIKYNQALTKMQEKYGKDRAYLNNDNFRNAWSNSYNPIAFIIQNTNRQNIPQKDKDKIIDYYTHEMSKDQLDTLASNMKNLKRLERGDF
jgi:hypothetical protein